MLTTSNSHLETKFQELVAGVQTLNYTTNGDIQTGRVCSLIIRNYVRVKC